jgi:cyclophilin family peptidyl-prolyl cis-trans isomerase
MKIREAAWVAAFTAMFAGLAQANTVVQFRIVGYAVDAYMEAELFDDDKPGTVRNFIRLIESGAYTNMFFHRLVPGFVMQGGGFRLTSDLSSHESVPNFGTITNEYLTGALRSNIAGTLAMAKVGGDPDSATSEFFINLADNSGSLDNQNGGFTVFGRVLSDTAAMIAFWNSLSQGYGIVNLGDPFAALPVNYPGTSAPTYAQLIYCDISLMRIAVSNSPAGRTISWDSAAGLTNLVEYTAAFAPPVWNVLLATNGTGARFSVTDTNSVSSRFYRVRVQ